MVIYNYLCTKIVSSNPTHGKMYSCREMVKVIKKNQEIIEPNRTYMIIQ